MKLRHAALVLILALGTLAVPAHHWAGAQVLSQPLNNATSSLAQAHSVGSDTLVLQSGHGSRFGTPSPTSPVRVTVARQSTLVGGQIVASTAHTIYLVTARSGDTLSGLTAVENTADQAFSKNDPVSSNFTAGTISEIHAALAAVPVDANVVHKTNVNETILGTKTFATPIALGSGGTGAATAVAARAALQAHSGRGAFAVSTYLASPRTPGTTDDSAAWVACVGACLAAGGGEVLVDVPLWLLGGTDIPGGVWDGQASGASNLVIRGRGDAAPITLRCPTRCPISLANWNLVELIDLVWIGGTAGIDCQYLVYGSSWQLLMQRCSFLDIRADVAVVNTLAGATFLDHCKFGGCGSQNGPATINAAAGGILALRATHMIDYGYSRGATYNTKTNPTYPWVRYRGNGSTGGPGVATGDGVAVHLADCFFDEGHANVLDVAKANPAGARIRGVVVEDCSGDLSVNLTPTFSIAGVDTFRLSGGDWGWQAIDTVMTLRDVRSAHVERLFVATGLGRVDADATVGAVRFVECSGVTKAPGYAAVRTVSTADGVTDFESPSSLKVGSLSGMVKASSGVLAAATAGTDYPGLATANTFSQDQTITSTTTADLLLTSTAASGRSWQIESGSDGVYSITDGVSGLRRWVIDANGNAALDLATNAAAKLYVPGMIYANRVGGVGLALNSNGTDYGFIQHDAGDTWSLAHGVNPPNAGTPRLQWSKTGAIVIPSGGTLAIGGGTPMTKVLSATATLDFPAVAAGGQQELTLSVTGAVAGDSVHLGKTAALEAGLIATARVSAADTVTVRVSNITGAPIDPASGTYRATVIRF